VPALAYSELLAIVEGEPKGVAECGERPLGSVRLRALKGDFVRLTGGEAAAFARTRAFPYNSNVSCSARNPHFRRINSKMVLDISRAGNAFGCHRPAIPGVITEDAVGLTDYVPAFYVMQVRSISLPGSYVPRVELCSKLADLYV